MWEENRDHTPRPGEEITDWYVPKQAEPQEVEGCYICARPLPERIRRLSRKSVLIRACGSALPPQRRW